MNKSFVIVIGFVLLGSLLLFSMTYTVKYHEVGIKTRFGKATDSIITEAGLGFKWPKPIDSVIKLDTRLQMIETPLETIQTLDGQQLVVRAFLLWRIDVEGEGPLNFYTHYKNASLSDATESLRSEFRTSVKHGVSNYRFNQLIGPDSQIALVEAAIQEQMQSIRDKGVRPVKVGFRQMSLPAKTVNAVISRMNRERKNLANLERVRGSAEATRIQSEAIIDSEKIMAFANQRAEEIRAQGDALAATYLQQMSEDEDLAIFLVWIDALEKSLSETTTFILEQDVAPWHLMNSNTPLDARSIPQPAKAYGATQNNRVDERRTQDEKASPASSGSLTEEGSSNE